MNHCRVTTKTGTYIGKYVGRVEEYLGIRYAAPVKPWREPEPVETTSEELIDALEFGPSSIQPYDEGEPCSHLWETSSDCLYLNIWTKDSSAKNKPTMFYIHGGSYVNGGSRDLTTYGPGFISNLDEGEDVVIVSVNYRLGIFGCLDLSDLEGYSDEYRHGTTLWMLDLIQALKWTKDNISAFGGNPDNITLFGQSAGSMSIAYLAASDMAKGLFRRGIMQSGTPCFGIIHPDIKKEESNAIFRELGIRNVKQLVSKDDKFWGRQYDEVYERHWSRINPRTADGEIIPGDFWCKLIKGDVSDIDLLIGSTSGEMDMYAYSDESYPDLKKPHEITDVLDEMLMERKRTAGSLNYANQKDVADFYIDHANDQHRAAVNVVNAMATQLGGIRQAAAQSRYAKTYRYIWDWTPDSKDLSTDGKSHPYSPWNRAPHCSELGVLFDSAAFAYQYLGSWYMCNCPDVFAKSYDSKCVPVSLVKKTVETWYAFAATGDPNNQYIPAFAPYDEVNYPTMVMGGDEWQCIDDPEREIRLGLKDIEIIEME